jgi:hypothetical protein
MMLRVAKGGTALMCSSNSLPALMLLSSKRNDWLVLRNGQRQRLVRRF